jgi:hypothetical protein
MDSTAQTALVASIIIKKLLPRVTHHSTAQTAHLGLEIINEN